MGVLIPAHIVFGNLLAIIQAKMMLKTSLVM
jgi:hypothetical protein